MTESPEPTLADVLAAVAALSSRFDSLEAKTDATAAKLDDLATDTAQGFLDMGMKLDQVAADVMAVKVDTGFIDRHIGDFQTWARRHAADPNAHHGHAA